MKPMNIDGVTVNFNERPKHKAVVAARGLMTREIMKLLDITDIDPTQGVSEALKAKLEENPELTSELAAVQSELSTDQTIILATDLDYSTLQELKEDMYADDFVELYNKSKEAMGGKTAQDFFAIYPTSTNFRQNPALKV
jgi:hypothetical protein